MQHVLCTHDCVTLVAGDEDERTVRDRGFDRHRTWMASKAPEVAARPAEASGKVDTPLLDSDLQVALAASGEARVAAAAVATVAQTSEVQGKGKRRRKVWMVGMWHERGMVSGRVGCALDATCVVPTLYACMQGGHGTHVPVRHK